MTRDHFSHIDARLRTAGEVEGAGVGHDRGDGQVEPGAVFGYALTVTRWRPSAPSGALTERRDSETLEMVLTFRVVLRSARRRGEARNPSGFPASRPANAADTPLPQAADEPFGGA